MPPFGSLFGLKFVVDPALEKDEYIFFNVCRRRALCRDRLIFRAPARFADSRIQTYAMGSEVNYVTLFKERKKE